jgi:hypothetical protein
MLRGTSAAPSPASSREIGAYLVEAGHVELPRGVIHRAIYLAVGANHQPLGSQIIVRDTRASAFEDRACEGGLGDIALLAARVKLSVRATARK